MTLKGKIFSNFEFNNEKNMKRHPIIWLTTKNNNNKNFRNTRKKHKRKLKEINQTSQNLLFHERQKICFFLKKTKQKKKPKKRKAKFKAIFWLWAFCFAPFVQLRLQPSHIYKSPGGKWTIVTTLIYSIQVVCLRSFDHWRMTSKI